MGIKRLYTFFRPSFRERNISELAHKRCAIDLMGWIYQGFFSLLEYCGDNTMLVLRSLERKIAVLQKYNVKVG